MLPEIACLYFNLVFFLLNLGPSNIWEHLIFATNMERQVFLISFCAVFLICGVCFLTGNQGFIRATKLKNFDFPPFKIRTTSLF